MTGTEVGKAGGDGFAPPSFLRAFVREAAGLFLYDAGAGPPLLLLHGNGDEADTWRRALPELAGEFRVLAPDLPGFGRSAPVGRGSLEDLSGAVVRLLDVLDVRGIHLVGSSLGAAVAASVTAGVPERVASLTLVGGGLPGSFGEEAQSSPLLRPGVGEAFYNGLRGQGQAAAYATLESFYADLAALPQAEHDFLWARVWARVWSDTQRDAFLAALRSLAEARSFALPNDLPLHLIWGERDAVVPLAAATKLQADFPSASLTVIPEAGHLPQQERPAEFVRALKAALSA